MPAPSSPPRSSISAPTASARRRRTSPRRESLSGPKSTPRDRRQFGGGRSSGGPPARREMAYCIEHEGRGRPSDQDQLASMEERPFGNPEEPRDAPHYAEPPEDR